MQGAHRARQFGISGAERFDRDAGGAEQLTQARDIELRVDQLADDFGQIRRTEDSSADLCRDDVTSRLVVNQREHGRGIENGHSVAAARRRSASNSSTNERDFGKLLARARNSATASC